MLRCEQQGAILLGVDDVGDAESLCWTQPGSLLRRRQGEGGFWHGVGCRAQGFALVEARGIS